MVDRMDLIGPVDVDNRHMPIFVDVHWLSINRMDRYRIHRYIRLMNISNIVWQLLCKKCGKILMHFLNEIK